ncbi:hypothetical protein NLJ89_g11042 [Agrocybe chaxingu]|uniref:Uncharacterized protein n=1 Tax=Agrocybe chaxingu TaxID=84603 RepID=A0A9W8JPG8_9AGAR|nr:hypothetical protein NLJ89_g11042 [Agrocybe chaxingu]
MSLLTTISRAGPSTQRVLLSRVALPHTPVTIDTPRFKAAKAKPTAIAVGQPGYKKNKEKKIKKRKPFPLFKSLSPAQLKSPIFQPTSPIPPLQLEPFTPTTAMKQNSVGAPLEFTPPENDPLRIFGLPRNLLIELFGK